MAVKAPHEGLCDFEAAVKPAKSFTARIDELTDRNTELEMELEQWKSTASQAELLTSTICGPTQILLNTDGIVAAISRERHKKSKTNRILVEDWKKNFTYIQKHD